MKVKPLKMYSDLELGRIVSPNDEFEVTKERGEYLIYKGYVEKVSHSFKKGQTEEDDG